MNLSVVVELAYLCVSIVICLTAVWLYKRGFNDVGVQLSSYVGLTALKGFILCELCASTVLFFKWKGTGDNMAAIAIALIVPLVIILCTIISSLVFGIIKMVPKTSKVVLPTTSMSKVSLRVNMLLIAVGLMSAVIATAFG